MQTNIIPCQKKPFKQTKTNMKTNKNQQTDSKPVIKRQVNNGEEQTCTRKKECK